MAKGLSNAEQDFGAFLEAFLGADRFNRPDVAATAGSGAGDAVCRRRVVGCLLSIRGRFGDVGVLGIAVVDRPRIKCLIIGRTVSTGVGNLRVAQDKTVVLIKLQFIAVEHADSDAPPDLNDHAWIRQRAIGQDRADAMGTLEHRWINRVFADALKEVDANVFAAFAAGDPEDGGFDRIHDQPLHRAEAVLAH